MKHTVSKNHLLLFIIGCLIFSYITIRAFMLSFTLDESFSFLEFVRKDFYTPDSKSFMLANNHLLNTWMMKLMSLLFGDSEFSLRLPNVFSYILFACYAAKIVLTFKNKPVFIVSAFLLLNLNLFVLDFFSIARGYGISIALMMGSLYYLLRFVRMGHFVRDAVVSLSFTCVGVLANLTMLNYLIVQLCVIIYSWFVYDRNAEKQWIVSFAKRTGIILIIPILLFCYTIPLFFELRKTDALYYGGENNFWQDTVVSTIKVFLYDKQYLYLLGILNFFILLVLITSAFFIVRDFVKKRSFDSFFAVLFAMILLCALSTIIQHWIMSTLYLMERTALLFFPLFSLLIVFLIHRLSEFKSRLLWIAPVMAVLLSLHFAEGMNFYFVQQWREESDVKSVIQYLEKKRGNLTGESKSILMGADFEFCPEIDYYRAKKKIGWLNSVRFKEFNILQDYYLLRKDSPLKAQMDSSEVEMYFPTTGNTLYRNLKKPISSEVVAQQKFNFESPHPEGKKFYYVSDKIGYKSPYASRTDTINVYSDGFEYIIPDSLEGHTLLVIFDAMVYADTKHFDGLQVFEFGSENKLVYSRFDNLKDYISGPKEWFHIHTSCVIPKQVKKGDLMQIYIWNIGRDAIFVDNMEFKIINYKF